VIAFQNSRAIFDLDNFVGDAGTWVGLVKP
jgi:hypothetical protein